MKIAVPRPGYRWTAASMSVLVVLSSALMIKNEAAAKRVAPQSSINARLRSAAVVSNSSSHPAQTAQARMLEAYGKLPLSFELNQGQTDQRVKFLSQGSGYVLFLTGNEAVLTLHKNNLWSKSGEQGRHRSPLGRCNPQPSRWGTQSNAEEELQPR